MTDRELLELAAKDDWICPWGLCPHDDAQRCRGETDARKDSCRRRFPSNMTAEQARQIVTVPVKSSSTAGDQAAAAIGSQ